MATTQPSPQKREFTWPANATQRDRSSNPADWETCHIFGQVLPELQVAIWEQAVLAPRLIQIEETNQQRLTIPISTIEGQVHSHELPNLDFQFCEAKGPVPALYAYEPARATFLRYNILSFENVLREPIYFNPTLDTLLFPSTDSFANFTAVIPDKAGPNPFIDFTADRESIKIVQNIAIYLDLGDNMGEHCSHIAQAMPFLPELKTITVLLPSQRGYDTGLLPRKYLSFPPESITPHLTQLILAAYCKDKIKHTRTLQRVFENLPSVIEEHLKDPNVGLWHNECSIPSHPYYKEKHEGVKWVMPKVYIRTLEELEEHAGELFVENDELSNAESEESEEEMEEELEEELEEEMEEMEEELEELEEELEEESDEESNEDSDEESEELADD